MSGRRRTLRRFRIADRRRSGTLTKILVLALALGVAACAVGERPDGGRTDGDPVPVDAPTPRPGEDPAEPPQRGDASVTIGVVLPRSGPPYLEQYADLVLEGIRLAATRYRSGVVDLVVLDDGGLPERDSALIEEARRRGAIAVIGPMLSPGVSAAAAAREDGVPALLSPTASALPFGAANTYTLNGVDLRGPRALAEYARRGNLQRAAVLYPGRDEFSRQAWAFRQAFEDLGGQVGAMVPYDSGTTTFATHIGRLVDSAPEVVYLPLSPQDVQLLAPQLAYYGFDGSGVVLLGNEAWTDEQVLREVSTRFTNGVIASTPSPRLPGESGWDEFVRMYEETYRRSLDNPFPALGYDAMLLVLDAADAGASSPDELADRLARTRAFRGATGVISVEAGEITRAPFLYRIQDGALTAPPAPDLLRPPGVDRAPLGADTARASAPYSD